MNFLEAVRELKEGRCEGIKRNEWVSKPLQKVQDIQNYCDEFEDYLSDDWQLVNPKPQYEEVEVKSYAVMRTEDNKIYAIFQREADAVNCGINNVTNHYIVEMKGIDRREIKPKVKRREQVSRSYCTEGSMIIPDGAKFYAEWEEEAP